MHGALMLRRELADAMIHRGQRAETMIYRGRRDEITGTATSTAYRGYVHGVPRLRPRRAETTNTVQGALNAAKASSTVC